MEEMLVIKYKGKPAKVGSGIGFVKPGDTRKVEKALAERLCEGDEWEMDKGGTRTASSMKPPVKDGGPK